MLKNLKIKINLVDINSTKLIVRLANDFSSIEKKAAERDDAYKWPFSIFIDEFRTTILAIKLFKQ